MATTAKTLAEAMAPRNRSGLACPVSVKLSVR